MNKFRFYFLQIFLFLFILSCIKDKNNIVNKAPDSIYYQQINDTLVGVKNDTLNIFSLSAKSIFQIYKIARAPEITYGVRISNMITGIFCDCGHDFLCKNVKGSLNALNYNDFITGNGLWGSIDSVYNLSDFSGKGERYLGFQNIYFPTGVSNYNYGWVKLYCSAANDTLIIIDYAVNQTMNNGIKAGQKK